MFKLIVIDDEVNIREGIRDYISQKHPEICVVDCFEDGSDAIEFLKSNDVHIILTDVKMLTVSGIDVARYVYQQKPEVKVIILSGYREFEYARSAISYNVKHYLMKPTDFRELSGVLEATVKELSEEEAQRKRVSYYEKYAPLLKEELLSDLLMGAIGDQQTLASKFDVLETGMNIESCSFCIVNLLVTNYHSYLSNDWIYGKEQLHEATKNFIETQNTKSVFLFHILSDNNSMKFICILPKAGMEGLRRQVTEHLQEIAVCADENLKIGMMFKVEKMYPSVEAMLLATARSIDSPYNEEQVRLLLSHINLGNYQQIDSLADSFIEHFHALGIYEAKQACLALLKTVTEKLGRAEITQNLELELAAICDVDEVAACLKKELHRLAQQLEESDVEQIVIKRAKDFINHNFCYDISLEDVANHVFLNPAYFSRYFKKYAGENFTAYLFELRMNHAKKLLAEGHTIDSTAKACGYSVSRYFVQSFKKYTGLTPKAYRLQFIQEETL